MGKGTTTVAKKPAAAKKSKKTEVAEAAEEDEDQIVEEEEEQVEEEEEQQSEEEEEEEEEEAEEVATKKSTSGGKKNAIRFAVPAGYRDLTELSLKLDDASTAAASGDALTTEQSAAAVAALVPPYPIKRCRVLQSVKKPVTHTEADNQTSAEKTAASIKAVRKQLESSATYAYLNEEGINGGMAVVTTEAAQLADVVMQNVLETCLVAAFWEQYQTQEQGMAISDGNGRMVISTSEEVQKLPVLHSRNIATFVQCDRDARRIWGDAVLPDGMRLPTNFNLDSFPEPPVAVVAPVVVVVAAAPAAVAQPRVGKAIAGTKRKAVGTAA